MQLWMQAASRFAPTGHALRNMERVAAAVSLAEPVLLVGETGTGKTTLVQQIAKQVRAAGWVVGLGCGLCCFAAGRVASAGCCKHSRLCLRACG